MSGVEIRVRSDSRQARRDLNKLENSVKNIEERTAAAGKAFRNLAIGIGAAFTGGVAVKGINNATDSLTNLENRIALVTGRGKDLDQTMNKLFKIAKATRGDIGGSAETFNRFGLALKESGKGADEILKAVESVNKAVAISGSGAESARAALFQLGQGLASGQLRGQELNSVLEQAPRLAQAIADEMGAPLGALRKLAEEGKVTTEVVFGALINQSEKLTKEFETMEGTSEQAFSVMKDQIGRVVGEISKGLNITSAFTQRFNAISDALETNREAIVSGVVGSFKAVGNLFSNITTFVKGTVTAIAEVIARLREMITIALLPNIEADVFERSAAALKDFFLVSRGIKTNASIIDRLINGVANAFNRLSSSLSDLSSDSLKVIANYSKIASDNFKELYERALRFSLLKYLEFRGGTGVLQDLKNLEDLQKLQNKVEESTARIFKNTADFAKKYLSKAWDSVKTFLNLIERKFYWVYDEVIQNSWWTDTMEQTYFLSEKWLGRTAGSVSKFGNTVKEKFKGVFESFKEAAKQFKGGVSIEDVKLKFNAASVKLAGLSETVKESVTRGLKSAMNFLSSLSPVISASFGAALVAGVTRFLSPELFKKTFGRIGPAAIAVLFAGIATDLAKVLKDAGIFSGLGANLGTTLAIAFDAVLDAIPVLVDGLIQGVASAGKAFGKALEGSIIGLPAKILSFLPGGGLLTSILYGSLGLAAINSKFRGVLGGFISQVVGKSSTLRQGQGVLQSIFFGENFTRASEKSNKAMRRSLATSDKAQKKSAQNAAANFASIAGKARIAHLGIMGAFSVGSVALFGDVVGTELSAIIGLVAGNIASSLLLTQTSFTSLTARFAGLRASITTGSVGIFTAISTAFKTAAVSANTSLTAINTKSTLTAASIGAKFKAMSGVVGTSFLRMGRFARIGIAGIAASLLLTSAAFADTGGAAEDAGTDIVGTLLNVGLAVTTVAALVPSIGKKIVKVAKSFAGPAVARMTAPLVAGFTGAFASISSAAAFAAGAIPVILAGGLATAIAAVTALAGVSIYSVFFGEGDTFSERLRNNTKAIKEFIFGVKRSITGVRSEISKITTDIDKGLDNLDIKVDITANLARANLAGFSDTEQSSLEKRIAALNKLQQQANAERTTYGTVSTGLLDEIRKSADKINETLLTQGGGAEGLRESNNDTFRASIDAMVTAVRLSAESNSELLLRATGGSAQGAQEMLDPNFRSRVIAQAPEFAVLDILKKFQSQQEDATPDQRKALASQALGAISLIGDDTPILKQFKDFFQILERENGVVTRATQKALDALVNKDLVINANALTGFRGENVELDRRSLSELSKVNSEGVFRDGIAIRTESITEIRKLLQQQGFNDIDNLELLPTEEINKVLEPLRKVGITLESILPGSAASKDLENVTQAEQALRLANQGASSEELSLLEKAQRSAAEAVKNVEESLVPLPVSFDILQEKLSQAGLPQLESAANADSLVNTPKLLTTFFDAIEKIEDTVKELDQISQDDTLSIQERLEKTSKLRGELNRLRTDQENYINLVNQGNILVEERGDLIASALEIDDYTFDINEVLGLDAKTLGGIIAAQNELEVLELKLRAVLASNTLSESIRTSTAGSLAEKIKEAEANVERVVLATGLGKRDAVKPDETIFEKFVGSLNDTGFSIGINEASRIGQRAINALSKPLSKIKALQKQIVNLSLSDTAARNKAVKALERQRDVIADILARGTVGQAKIGLEAIGVDTSVLDQNNPVALELAKSIADNQELLNNTLVSDLSTRKEITSEIEEQQRLLDGITTQAQNSTSAVAESLKENLKGVLTGATSVKDALFGVLDTISDRIISTVVDSFVDSFIQSAGLKEMFDGLFANLFSGFDGAGKDLGSTVSESISTSLAGVQETGGFTSFFSSLSSGFSSLISGLGSGLSGALSGIGGLLGGGGGGLGGLFSMGMSFLGFSQGGVVPNTPFSQVGKDSVPAMLMPGEVVMSKNDVRNMNNNQSGTQQSFSINVQGDVSRQTRKEIVKMLPQITNGVNMQNKEKGRRA